MQLATLAKIVLSLVTVSMVLVATTERDTVYVSQDGKENAVIKVGLR